MRRSVVVFIALVAFCLLIALASAHKGGRHRRLHHRHNKLDHANLNKQHNTAQRVKLGIEGEVNNYSGYITINQTSHMFYWFFESQNDPVNDPFILWMTGGPGCSSILALFTENGPYRVNANGTGISANPYSWNTNANVLWVDQPVGTGFSYSDDPNKDYVKDEAQMAADMWEFLQKFFQQYPQFLKNDFYIIGESYGGHYVPALSAKILAMNNAKAGAYINQAGLGIGNGLVAPRVQYGAYGEFAYQNNLISKREYEGVNKTYHLCADLIEKQDWTTASIVCNGMMEAILKFAGNINIYDIRKQCEGPLCYDFDNVITYLNTPSVQKALHIAKSNFDWQPCSNDVHAKLTSQDWFESFREDIPVLIEAGRRVLVYSGDQDFVCNWIGGYEWTHSMKWSGQQQFNTAPLQTYVVDGKPAGTFQSVNNQFTFLRVYQAGHMVPMDQPAVALDMVNRFISNTPLATTTAAQKR